VNQAPIVFSGHRVQVAFAQKALIVCLHQLIDAVGIPAGLVVEKLNRPRILHSPMNGFLFLVAANGSRDFGRSHGQRQEDQ
jgi:hypothetical protein